ncbi:MAG: SpoIVB peptidase [Oscillospiraceae bacterium]|nr:SpoIVB peptidase [Oscillospiraceae bacterium]
MNIKNIYAKIFSGASAALVLCLAVSFGIFRESLPCVINSSPDSPVAECGFSGTTLRRTSDGYAYYLANFPIKTAEVVEKQRRSVILCGTPFGIKIRSDGVMVVKTADRSPARSAGIKEGDIIKSVNGETVRTNSDISRAVQRNSDETYVVLERSDRELCFTFEPKREADGLKMGIFVRDSAAGVGTLTFIEPKTKTFGGLGHSVSDVTTGDTVPLLSGEITKAEIYGIVKGKSGSAGELCGLIFPETETGKICSNTEAGIFGEYCGEVSGEEYPAAFRQEVKTGAATVITTTDGSSPKQYSIEIERINLFDLDGSKSMVIRITDPVLLEETGGIVRGMSGSPIIQDGKFVGAVTHVLVNDPTRGYAIFAENMLSNAVGSD